MSLFCLLNHIPFTFPVHSAKENSYIRMKDSNWQHSWQRSQMASKLIITFVLLAALFIVANSEDFYEQLGIERDADAKDIRRAFKKLALTMHPDKNPVRLLRAFHFY